MPKDIFSHPTNQPLKWLSMGYKMLDEMCNKRKKKRNKEKVEAARKRGQINITLSQDFSFFPLKLCLGFWETFSFRCCFFFYCHEKFVKKKLKSFFSLSLVFPLLLFSHYHLFYVPASPLTGFRKQFDRSSLRVWSPWL